MQTHKNLAIALEKESEKFRKCYLWLEAEMPSVFFQEISQENLLLVTHSLMGFELQDYYSTINLKGAAIALTLDLPEADLRILQTYALRGIKSYQTFVSKAPLPFSKEGHHLRIITIAFADLSLIEKPPLTKKARDKINIFAMEHNPKIPQEELDLLLKTLDSRFLNALSSENIVKALSMYFRAKTRDSCQYEVHWNLEWKEKNLPSMQIVLAWKNTPIHHFLYRIARTVHRHHLVIRRIDATYADPYSRNSTLVMVLDLHGEKGKGVEDCADIPEFLRELITFKYFSGFDAFDQQLVSKGLISNNFANVLRAIQAFVHQALVHIDPNLYTLENITEGLCRHPDLIQLLSEAFKWKFHPGLHDFNRFLETREKFLALVDNLDTGQEEYDLRRKNILRQAMNMLHYTLKTNAYRMNFTALSFRLDPHYLDEIPFDRSKKFPEMPFALFFIKGMHFFGFHIRFKDLARGGLRTVFIEQKEKTLAEQNSVFTECYHLAYTQHLKNKDIPEGGAKGIIFLKPFEWLETETEIYKKDLLFLGGPTDDIEEKISLFKREQNLEYLFQSQRAFVENLVLLVNCHPDGKLKVRGIVDYWEKPEYLYLGPDENMHDAMIQWIADYSKKYDYKPRSSFISGKPKIGINHKEYGVTSLGLNVYMQQFLNYIGINPEKDIFTVKMVGGPDGDVAGNQILNLKKFYPNTAKLLSITDVSGTIHDPKGLDLTELSELFSFGKPVAHYPIEKLSPGGFLVNKVQKKDISAVTTLTACWKKQETQLIQEWISGSEMNHLLKTNINQTKADVFIPAGGRPRSLNESNVKEFLDASGKPTAKIIIEGANLYLTAGARRELEKLGALIIRDSSANKTGVICSSFEVLAGLSLGDEAFFENKDILVKEILERLRFLAYQEANLMIEEHRTQGTFLTDISAKISERINLFTDQLLSYLETIALPKDPNDPLIQCYLNYALPFLKDQYQEALLQQIPELHKKAIIACHVGAELVYQKGLHWFPAIVDILPIILPQLPQRLALQGKEC